MERVRLEFPAEAWTHRHPLAVRITDMNYGRHLGHDALVSLLHEARTQAFAALEVAEWDIHGHPSVVADLAIQYQAEARWPELLEVQTALPVPDGKALVAFQRVVRPADGVQVALARLNLLLLDPASGRPVAVPEALRERLTRREGG
ncbi:thioesterase [Bisbaumannia pacifica]|uniref:Thioesterase n=1 Tax=Bisbaumannia pacifica TaxID=77098 RepID=A0A510X6X4_9GAMM|nr:thioesterase family protein [Halomonas pacifica]GEK46205.1 thioesterase [Halomonas pacifica]